MEAGSDASHALAESVGRTVRLEAYYTQAQLDTLERRAAAMGQDRIRDAQEEWSRIFRTYGEAMARGKPADHPDVLALMFYDETVTYRQLDERTDAVAAHLQEAGVEAGDRVAFMGELRQMMRPLGADEQRTEE